MVTFYEYLFYRMYWYYVIKCKEDIGNETLRCVFTMSFFQTANYVTIYDNIKYTMRDYYNWYSDVWEYWIPLTIIIIVDYLYFSYKNRDKRIVDYWSQVTKQRKIKLDIILVSYLVISTLLLMGTSYIIKNRLRWNTLFSVEYNMRNSKYI